MPPLCKMFTFSCGHLFLASIFYQLTSEMNQLHTSNMTHCKQTLQMIKFYLIKIKKIEEIGWHNSSFPSQVFYDHFVYHMVKFVVSLPSLTSVHLFAFLTILTIVANKCKEHIKCVQLLKTSLISFINVEYYLNI